jgi:hypothetical protein
MIGAMKLLRRKALAAFGREDGTASMEFVLMVPLFIMVFMASFESGLMMIRSIMLDQAVDVTMRDLRLGHYTLPTEDTLRTAICSRTVIFSDCEANMLIELDRVSTADWAMPDTPTQCINRDEEIDPVVALQIGQQNDIMLIRVCEVQNAIFPSTGIGLGLSVDSQGGYELIARSAFVVEPT